MDNLGYTQFEMILVLVVLAIFTSILSMPFKIYERVSQNLEFNQLVRDIKFNRDKSLLEGSDIKIELEENAYVIICKQKNKLDRTRKEFSSNLKIDSSSFRDVADEIRFQNGVCLNSGHMKLLLNGKLVKITVTPVYSNINMVE